MRVVKDVEPVVSGAFGPTEHFGQSLEAHRAPVLCGKPGAQIAEDVAGRKRIPRSGHKSVIKKFCCPRLLVHVFLVCRQTRGRGLCSGQHSPFRETNSGVSLGAEKGSRGLEISSLPRHRMAAVVFLAALQVSPNMY